MKFLEWLIQSTKMKYPKTIKINGNVWQLKQVDRNGGRFSYTTMTIEIEKKPHQLKDGVLFHEIMEIIMCENRVRYDGTSDNQYKFFLTHDDFTRVCDMAFATMKDNKLF